MNFAQIADKGLILMVRLIARYTRVMCYNSNESEVILMPKIDYMTKERYEYLNKLIKASNISIDFNTGLITGPRGGHGYINNKGYYMYALYDKKLKKYNQVLQHTIIAISAFGPKIIGKQVDHINNRHSTTYDNRLDNLQLLSPTENRNKFWNAPYRDNSSFSTPVFYISKSEIKLYPTLRNFCKVKNISMVYVEKMERLNKYIPKIKGFVVFIGRQYLSENR